MLRWFRKYNKWFLSIGGTILMVIFLIQGVLPQLARSRDRIMGRIGSQKIMLSQRNSATTEIDLIRHIDPRLGLLTPRDPMAWLLMLADAKRMGLSAGPSQVNQLLSLVMDDETNPDNRNVEHLAEATDTNPLELTEAIEHWLIVQQYQELIDGLGHLTDAQRLTRLKYAEQMERMGYDPSNLLRSLSGQPRVSLPLLERFVQDEAASLTIKAVAVSPADELGKVPEPDEQTIQKLYDQYKNDLPGGDKGYGLGYKLPNRVQIEYLDVPFDRLRHKVQIDETQAVRYYDQHIDEFTTHAAEATSHPASQPGKPKVTPYMDVRDRIISSMTDQAAQKMGDQVVKEVQAMLIDNARGLAEEEGYRKVPPDWKGMSFEDVAKRVQDKFDVLLTDRIVRQWLTMADLVKLPVLGDAYLGGAQQAPAVAYVMSVRELAPSQSNPLTQLHLQVGLPGLPVTASNGDQVIFRLLAADPAHSPPLSEVHDQVARDARRVAAYKLLKDKQDAWQQRVQTVPLDKLAKDLNTTVMSPPAFQRRVHERSGELAAPLIPGIGRSEGFVDAVFSIANRLPQSQPAASMPAKVRAGAIPVDSLLTLYLVQVDDYQPISRHDFEQFAMNPQVLGQIEATMTGRLESSPFSVDSLAKRVGFVWDPEMKGKETASPSSNDLPEDY